VGNETGGGELAVELSSAGMELVVELSSAGIELTWMRVEVVSASTTEEGTEGARVAVARIRETVSEYAAAQLVRSIPSGQQKVAPAGSLVQK
jgi:hypothetical protein